MRPEHREKTVSYSKHRRLGSFWSSSSMFKPSVGILHRSCQNVLLGLFTQGAAAPLIKHVPIREERFQVCSLIYVCGDGAGNVSPPSGKKDETYAERPARQANEDFEVCEELAQELESRWECPR